VAELAAMSANEEIFKERITELELALHDNDGSGAWDAIFGDTEGFQFTRAFIDDLIHTSRLYYLKNPVIKRPVDLQAVYVWGQGVSIRAEGALNEIVQGFWADPANRRSFTGHDALMDSERRLRVEGNLFLRIFTNPATGRVKVRRIPVEEIRAIVFNPEDHDEPWFYLRKIKRTGGEPDKEVAYPDWRYARERKIEERADGGRPEGGGVRMSLLAEFPDAVIEWDTPVMHRKTGGFGDMDFGVPETYAAIDWARAYKDALTDYKKTIKALATWAWKMKLGGGQAQLTAAATALGTTFGTNDQWTETNPTPTAGSLMALLGENDLRAIDVSKAAVDPDGFRRLLLMSASAMGMPEIYYGAAEGNFATAKSMDRPTELQFLDRQALWADIITEVLSIAVEAAALAPGNKAVSSTGYDEINGQMKLRSGGEEVDLDIEVDFPPILQKDVQAYLQALTTFTTQNGQAIQAMNDGPTLYRLALTALGVDNVEEVVEIFYPSDGGESEAKPIETYEPPLSPEDVQEDLQKQLEDNKAKAEQQAQAKADAAQRMAGGPLGNQPRAQGPAGGDKEPQGRGGANATARESDIDEAQARVDFMRSLIEMRQELAASAATQTN
jgi:hypothetical protein